MERRGVDVDDHLRPGERLVACGAAREPHVFADRHPDRHATDLEQVRLVTRVEVALLIEDAVVREHLLVVLLDHLALVEHGGRVVEVIVEIEATDDQRRETARLFRELLEARRRLVDEGPANQQVLRRVPGQCQLGERHEVDVGLRRATRRIQDQRLVGLEVPDRRVELSEGNA